MTGLVCIQIIQGYMLICLFTSYTMLHINQSITITLLASSQSDELFSNHKMFSLSSAELTISISVLFSSSKTGLLLSLQSISLLLGRLSSI